MTPCADVTGVATMGLMQVLNEPRTTLAQALNAILIAELADNAGWDMLISLARETGNEAIAERFREPLQHEADHLAQVKMWLEQLTSAEAKLLTPTT
jgi:hypothetical protein